MPRPTIKVLLHREFILELASARAWTITQLALAAEISPKILKGCLDEADPKPATMKTLGKLAAKLNVPPQTLKYRGVQKWNNDKQRTTITLDVNLASDMELELIMKLIKAITTTLGVSVDAIEYKSHRAGSLLVDVDVMLVIVAMMLDPNNEAMGGTYIDKMDVSSNPPHNKLFRGLIIPRDVIHLPVLQGYILNGTLAQVCYALRARSPSTYHVRYGRDALSVYLRKQLKAFNQSPA